MPVQVGGNIGTPVTAMVEASRPDQWNVLELSSFQLETICRFRADIAVCLNVTQNHLDRHHTFANYANAKAPAVRDPAAGRFRRPECRRSHCVEYAARTCAHARVVQRVAAGHAGPVAGRRAAFSSTAAA